MLELIKNVLWSPITVINILLLGLFIIVKTHFYTVLKLPKILSDTVFYIKNNKRAFSLMCTSLGGTIGVGNAIGVAGAITEGGSGAVFWMAIAGFIGMAIKYAEVYLSMIYNGPIMYIEKGIGSKILSHIYAIMCICVSLGMGNMAQTMSATTAVQGIIPFNQKTIALIFVLFFLCVAKGGIEKIRKFSEFAVPLASLLYILMLFAILFRHRIYLHGAIRTILNGSGIAAGFKWALIKDGITKGFSKAVFSSEAGLGSAGFSHTESYSEPKEQAKWAVIEVLIDCMICIMTALAIIVSEKQVIHLPESYITRGVFWLSFGAWGEALFGFSMLIFGFASIICWYYNGVCAVKYICKSKTTTKLYCVIFAIVIFLSSFVRDGFILDISDIANALMLIVNICALWVLVLNNSLTF